MEVTFSIYFKRIWIQIMGEDMRFTPCLEILWYLVQYVITWIDEAEVSLSSKVHSVCCL